MASLIDILRSAGASGALPDPGSTDFLSGDASIGADTPTGVRPVPKTVQVGATGSPIPQRGIQNGPTASDTSDVVGLDAFGGLGEESAPLPTPPTPSPTQFNANVPSGDPFTELDNFVPTQGVPNPNPISRVNNPTISPEKVPMLLQILRAIAGRQKGLPPLQ